MNRGRRPNPYPHSQDAHSARRAPIDLGLALSVYGRDSSGNLVEIGRADDGGLIRIDLTGPEAPTTEH